MARAGLRRVDFTAGNAVSGDSRHELVAAKSANLSLGLHGLGAIGALLRRQCISRARFCYRYFCEPALVCFRVCCSSGFGSFSLDAPYLIEVRQARDNQNRDQAKKKAEMDSAKQDVSFGSQARSYVFQPYTMVNDHRTELKIPDVQRVMDGDIDPFIEAFLKRQSAAA